MFYDSTHDDQFFAYFSNLIFTQNPMVHVISFTSLEPSASSGRPRSVLHGVVRPTSTHREPSAFEVPSSSAPPALSGPQEPIFIVSSGLTRLKAAARICILPRHVYC